MIVRTVIVTVLVVILDEDRCRVRLDINIVHTSIPLHCSPVTSREVMVVAIVVVVGVVVVVVVVVVAVVVVVVVMVVVLVSLKRESTVYKVSNLLHVKRSHNTVTLRIMAGEWGGRLRVRRKFASEEEGCRSDRRGVGGSMWCW